MFDFLPPTQTIPDAEIKRIREKVVSLLDAARLAHCPRPETIFHYTDAQGLTGIIKSGVVQATHIAFMNDASEYLHAVELLLCAVRRAKSERLNRL